MVIRQTCQSWEHQFEWFVEYQGVSSWVCRKCGEWRDQNEDLGSGC